MAITFAQLRTFLAVAETGSVRLAAEQLYVTQPSVSAGMAALKRELGVDLFEPNGRGIRLTPAGEALVPYATRIVGLMGEARRSVPAIAGHERDVVRLVAGTTAADYIVPRLLAAFRDDDMPRVMLQAGTRRMVLSRVGSHLADVGLTGTLGAELSHEPLVVTPWCPNALVVVGKAVPTTLEEATWVLREDGTNIRVHQDRLLARLEPMPTDTLVFGSSESMKRALMVGLGVGLIPQIAVQDELKQGELCIIPVPGTPVEDHWAIVIASDVPMRRAVERFCRFLQSARARAVVAQMV